MTPASFVVMLVTLGVNLLVVRYESERGRALKSELLLADAAHTRSDVLTSCAVLVSLAGVWLGYPQLDAIGGLVVAVFIAHTGFQIAPRGLEHPVGPRRHERRRHPARRDGRAGGQGLPPHPHPRLGGLHVSRHARLVHAATRRSTRPTACRTWSRIG